MGDSLEKFHTLALPKYFQKDEGIEGVRRVKIGVKGLSDSGTTSIPRFFIHPPETLADLKKPSPSSTSTRSIPIIDLSEMNSPSPSKAHRTDQRSGRDVGVLPADQPRRSGVGPKRHRFVRESFPRPAVRREVQVLQARRRTRRHVRQQQRPLPRRRGLLARLAPSVARPGAAGGGGDPGGVSGGGDRLGLTRDGGGGESDGVAVGRPDLTVGITPHTDPGVLTVLMQNQVPGLQVKHGDVWVGGCGAGARWLDCQRG
ncbi:hypothetical protein TIFTF001_008680 [Ficus carica]|uniref:Isopenicillin N synthase-like Fe(2+) 2OG dioxygenase domain-containing protein n=1 Tax=Ficus carica TaxID=3494 RepID=A0AA88AFF5_FICCA|nr:hypothetical protein TIFTF001_008680 [Ficus carica]